MHMTCIYYIELYNIKLKKMKKKTWKLAKIVSHKNRLLLGSIPVEGSSSKTNLGAPTIAIENESFLRVPPEHSSVCLLACSAICSPLRYKSTILQHVQILLIKISKSHKNTKT